MDQAPLQRLEEKLEQLLLKYQQLQKENKNLRASIQQTETVLAKSKKENVELLRQNDALKLGTLRPIDEEQKKLLQTRIDGYLKEINKCLSLLDA